MSKSAIERLIEFHDYLKSTGYGGRNKFEKVIGKSEGYLSGAIKKNSSIGSEVLLEVATMFPEVSLEWLITGRGNMLNSDNKEGKPYLVTKSGTKYFELPNGMYRMRVPLVPYEAYAKYIDEHRDADFIEELQEVDFIVDKIGLGRYFAFVIKGDSMDDGSIKSFPHGTMVLARELSKEHWQEGNGLHINSFPYWILVLKNTILCKQITKQDVESGKITCHSLSQSPEYTSDFDLELEDVIQLLSIVQKTLPVV